MQTKYTNPPLPVSIQERLDRKAHRHALLKSAQTQPVVDWNFTQADDRVLTAVEGNDGDMWVSVRVKVNRKDYSRHYKKYQEAARARKAKAEKESKTIKPLSWRKEAAKLADKLTQSQDVQKKELTASQKQQQYNDKWVKKALKKPEYANRLKKVRALMRKKDRLPRAELAKRLGIHNSQISILFGPSPRRVISENMARRVEKAMGLAEGYLG